MPVPVPLHNKPVSHPVVKHPRTIEQSYSSDLQHLARSLPVSPSGPPPSFGTREQWINSLPSWRRTKPRRIWEEDTHLVPEHHNPFLQGLTVADNATVIKGARAQACIPPLGTLLESLGVSQPVTNMPALTFGSTEGCMVGTEYGKIIAHSMNVDVLDVPAKVRSSDYCIHPIPILEHDKTADSPMSDDDCPGTVVENDDGSSPLEPITPFSEFVDRAVSTPAACPRGGLPSIRPIIKDAYYAVDQSMPYVPLQVPCRPPMAAPKEPVPAPVSGPEVVTPSASPGYRKLAEPLAEWIANYVWRVCTTGFSLPPKYSVSSASAAQRPLAPPSYLAASVHTLFLSTLLQPSAVFLAIWYIVRLPVYFDAIGLDVENSKESAFRAALLASHFPDFGSDTRLAAAPFRLIVLGCMLANKWLDDHTFSNKTWHTISNVPIDSLNKLESLALAIFSYDLSVPSHEWDRWLSHVLSYHCSLASPSHPQPISRPSTNPHSIIRKAIEEIILASSSNSFNTPQPVFIGLETRRKEKLDRELMLDIDLDEDGPLREEYLPRRRSGASTQHEPLLSEEAAMCVEELDRNNILPSPAKWSPSNDEPILRERNTTSGNYVAVQPPLVTALPPYQMQHQYQPCLYPGHWVSGNGYVGAKPSGCAYDGLVSNPPLTTLNPYPFVFHSRSQSVSYDQDQSRSHMRSYSQSHFDYRWSNFRVTVNDQALPHHDLPWAASHGLYGYPPQSFAPHVPPQSAWLRT